LPVAFRQPEQGVAIFPHQWPEVEIGKLSGKDFHGFTEPEFSKLALRPPDLRIL